MGVSLILEELFSGSSVYDMACFSILASNVQNSPWQSENAEPRHIYGF